MVIPVLVCPSCDGTGAGDGFGWGGSGGECRDCRGGGEVTVATWERLTSRSHAATARPPARQEHDPARPAPGTSNTDPDLLRSGDPVLNFRAHAVLVEYMAAELAAGENEPGSTERQQRAIAAGDLVFGAEAFERTAQHFLARRATTDEILAAAVDDSAFLLQVMQVAADDANRRADLHAAELDILVGPAGRWVATDPIDPTDLR